MKILLYSGGIDSLIAWYYLKFPLRMYVDLGTRYADCEMQSIFENDANPHSIMFLHRKSWGVYERADSWLPMRNMLLIMIAVAEGGDIVYIVSQKGEQSLPDRQPSFFENMSTMMSQQNNRDIEVHSVFPHMDKSTMVAWYLASGHDPERLINAYSCYSGRDPCGQCAACWRKFIALEDNGLSPLGPTLRGKMMQWGVENYFNRLDEYIPERVASMRRVMGWVK